MSRISWPKIHVVKCVKDYNMDYMVKVSLVPNPHNKGFVFTIPGICTLTHSSLTVFHVLIYFLTYLHQTTGA